MKLKQLLCVLNNSSRTTLLFQSSSTNAEIDIPKRIPRGSTDILKAIANTYQRDPTAAHYKYHDDPFLIPYSNNMKRSYALSQESGRKAAQWIRQQHADLFQHKVADPQIEAFIPKPVYDEGSEVNEEILLKLISNAHVSDAITVYNNLKKQNKDISLETKQGLCEFLCYFNAEDPIPEEWIEERWFRLGSKEKHKNTWRRNEIVDDLFNELKDKYPASYSAVICGMCKHGEITKAFELYDEAQSKVIPLNVEVYNLLLGKVYLIRESHDRMWLLMKELLGEMNRMKVQPNIGTLNGVFETLSKMSTNRDAKRKSQAVLSEFKSLNIEPSLATFLYLLEVYYKDKPKLIGVLAAILNVLQNNTYIIKDPNDILFFVRAMEICSQLGTKELGYRLNNILMKDNNYDFLGDSFKESVYYRNFFFLLSNTESLDKLIEWYDKLIPSVYIPEPAVTNAILTSLLDNMAWNLLPKIWSDIVLFEQSEISGVLENTLKCAAGNTDASLDKDMCNIVWDIWTKMEGQRRERTLVHWSASMLGNGLLTLLTGNEHAKAHLVMNKLITLGSALMNEPPISAIKAYIDCCIEDNTPDMAIKTIQYCDDMGFVETSQFAKHLAISLELTDKQHEKLASIVGAETLKKSNTPKSES